MSVKAPAERNFRRARVRPVGRRKQGLRRWWSWRAIAVPLAALALVYTAHRLAGVVVQAAPFRVSRIAVHGNVRLSSGEVQAIVEGLHGSSILTVDLNRYRRRLMQSPWIADVALRRVLPSTVEIFVSERRPMALCRLGTALYLIDPHGAIIDEYGPQYAEFDLPIIDGLVRTSSARATVDAERAELAGRVIDALAARKDLAQKVSQIDVSDAHDAVVLLQDDPALLHLGEDHFLERIQSYEDLAPALRERIGNIDYADMRFDQRVYVRPASIVKKAEPSAKAGRHGSSR
ncbi:MAG TPA: FtsQ-type POTRA domain-containing protein [Vicinamibacterales bacterium]|jgi:cell division septal protein FtsQ